MSGRRSHLLSAVPSRRGLPVVVALTLAGLLGASLYVAPELVRPSVAAAATVAPVPLTAPDEPSARASARLSGQRVQVASD